VPFDGHRLCHRGCTDQERLRNDELVYTGVVRTPVMALVQRAPCAGGWQNVAADFFATTADVYRATGELGEGDDMLDAADRGGKSRVDSLRRLARMLGADSAAEAELRAFAEFVAARQQELIEAALERLLAARPALRGAPIVGAGCGQFLARRIAGRTGVRYIDFNELVDTGKPREAAVCATAVAVAWLARQAAA
jgi:probable H4MPT-linked C1 transfer pathway protein